MSWFKLALFLHVIGILGLFSALALQFAAIFMLRRAVNTAQVRDAGFIFSKLSKVFGPSGAFIWLSGIYLTVLRISDHESIGWVIVALILFAIMGVVGASFGKRMSKAMRAQLSKDPSRMTDSLQALIRSRELLANACFGLFAALGIVTLMIFKPTVAISILVLAVALLLGFIVLQRLSNRPSAETKPRAAKG